MTPTAYRAGGAGLRIRFAVGQCAYGAILAAASDKGVCAILLGDEPEALVRALEDSFPKAELVGGDAEFEQCMAKIVGFVAAPTLGLALPPALRRTTSQHHWWPAHTH